MPRQLLSREETMAKFHISSATIWRWKKCGYLVPIKVGSMDRYRLSWAALRIAMVLTALRMMDSGHITDKIECTDTDFNTAMSLIRTISAHNDYIFNVLNDGISNEVKVSETCSSAARSALLSVLPDRFTAKDMQAAASHIGKTVRTVERQIRRAIEKGQVHEISKGNYEKM